MSEYRELVWLEAEEFNKLDKALTGHPVYCNYDDGVIRLWPRWAGATNRDFALELKVAMRIHR